MAQGGVAVRLDWAPPLHVNRVAQPGLATVVLSALLGLLERLLRVRPAALRSVETPAATAAVPSRPVAASALAAQMRQLGVRLREEFGDGPVLRETLTAIAWMIDRHPLLASRPLREGFHEAAAAWSLPAVLSSHGESVRERLRRLLNRVGDRAELRTGAGYAIAA